MTKKFREIHSIIKSGETTVVYTFNKINRLQKAKIEDYYTLTQQSSVIVTPIRCNGTINF